jgi:hypothetical protein
MATNPYFNKFKSKPEQQLIDDLVTEAIKIHGIDTVYIPRTLVSEDEIFGEDRLPKFENGHELEMYVETYDGYEGEGEVMTQFGLDIKDEITLSVSRSRFLKEFAKENYKYPREGDLIYFPLTNGLFEINLVERDKDFYNFGKIFTYSLKCSLFKYSGEDLDTGFDIADGATSDVNLQLIEVVMGSGSGEFIEGERVNVYAGGVTGGTLSVVSWITESDTMQAGLVAGDITGVNAIVGQNSGASYAVSSIGFTQDFFVKSLFEDNTDFQLQGNSFIDFTDTDPFSEGDL